MGKQGCESIFLKNSKIQADTLTLERSILMNTLSNDANANCLLIFILRRLINQLRLYNLIEYSLRYDNNKTGNLIHVLKIIKVDTLTLERSISMNTVLSDTNSIGLLIFILRRIINRLVLHNLIKYSLRYNNRK